MALRWKEFDKLKLIPLLSILWSAFSFESFQPHGRQVSLKDSSGFGGAVDEAGGTKCNCNFRNFLTVSWRDEGNLQSD